MAGEDRRKKLVKKASKMKDPAVSLGCIPDDEELRCYDGERLTVETAWATHLSEERAEWVFDLFRRNMRTLYERSQWGFDAPSKKAELGATTARFIILRNTKGFAVAYAHYRLDVDHGSAVLYCYEIQVEPEYQRKGIGSILMSILDRLADKLGMDKVLATVFTYNELSLDFFRKLGFAEDETTPPPEMEVDYVILGKACAP